VRATLLVILAVLLIAGRTDPAIPQTLPGLLEIDPANLADLPPGVTPPQAVTSHAVSGADYPLEALILRQMGLTIVRYVVLEDGSIGPVEIVSSSGYPSLDEAATVIVRRWRFSPATRDGRPIRVWQRANVVFNPGS
jgi:periplasmic protein TonB